MANTARHLMAGLALMATLFTASQWRHRVLAGALLIGLLTGRASAQTPVLIGFLEGDTHVYMRRAVEGAAARLARPGCQDLFADFTDASGQPLSTTLAASGRSPADAFNLLRFCEERRGPRQVQVPYV